MLSLWLSFAFLYWVKVAVGFIVLVFVRLGRKICFKRNVRIFVLIYFIFVGIKFWDWDFVFVWSFLCFKIFLNVVLHCSNAVDVFADFSVHLRKNVRNSMRAVKVCFYHCQIRMFSRCFSFKICFAVFILTVIKVIVFNIMIFIFVNVIAGVKIVFVVVWVFKIIDYVVFVDFIIFIVFVIVLINFAFRFVEFSVRN